MKYNECFDKLRKTYVFGEMRDKVARAKAGGRQVIDLGVGDVTEPLFSFTAEAMKKACDEMGVKQTFRGYPPSQGYDFLREKIAAYYGGEISPDEVFITDGAKGELGNICELFGRGKKVLFPTPCYPAGLEANLLCGNEVETLKTFAEDGFLPFPPYGKTYDLIYLCSPQNPTGALIGKELLSLWIGYALNIGAVIIFDSAYSEFIPGGEMKNIYGVSGAKNCVVEINSYSKSFGFTGIRCGYTIIPHAAGRLNELKKRQSGCRFNGVSYITQRGAETFYSPEGAREIKNRINFYKTNADILKIALKNANLWYNISRASPYAFVKAPDGFSGDEFCEYLLDKLGLAVTPGSGFSDGGEDFVRFSAFCSREDALKAADILSGAVF